MFENFLLSFYFLSYYGQVLKSKKLSLVSLFLTIQWWIKYLSINFDENGIPQKRPGFDRLNFIDKREILCYNTACKKSRELVVLRAKIRFAKIIDIISA